MLCIYCCNQNVSIPTVFFTALPVIVGPSNLMCFHDNYLVASDPENSTAFCKLQGQPYNIIYFVGLGIARCISITCKIRNRLRKWTTGRNLPKTISAIVDKVKKNHLNMYSS